MRAKLESQARNSAMPRTTANFRDHYRHWLTRNVPGHWPLAVK